MARVGGVDDDRLAGAELAGERDRAVDHEVREVAQEELVLAAGRLALGRVHHDDRPTAAFGHGPDLAGDRKACAPAARKPARLELAQQLAALELEPPVTPKVLSQAASAASRPEESSPARSRAQPPWSVRRSPSAALTPGSRGASR